jgi:hypothetical protein
MTLDYGAIGVARRQDVKTLMPPLMRKSIRVDLQLQHEPKDCIS